MSITFTQTRHASLGMVLSRLGAHIATAFAWAERSSHHRLGSAFMPPEALRNLNRAVEDATGRPVGSTATGR